MAAKIKAAPGDKFSHKRKHRPSVQDVAKKEQQVAGSWQDISNAKHVAKLMSYLDEHPHKAGPLRGLVESGFLDHQGDATEEQSARSMLPESCTLWRHCSQKVLASWLTMLSGGSCTTQALARQRKSDPKAYVKMLVFALAGSFDEKVVIKDMRIIKQCFEERHRALGSRLDGLMAKAEGTAASVIDWATMGYYTLTDWCEDTLAYKAVVHINGSKAPPNPHTESKTMYKLFSWYGRAHV